MHTPEIAKRVYPSWRTWGATALLADAELVCPWCKAVKLPEKWDRLKAKRDRAYHLASLSNNDDKDRAYYNDELGTLPEPDPDPEDEEELAW